MLIHNLVATGSLSYNGVNISYVTGSQTSLDGLNQFSASVNTTTGSLSSSIAILSGSYLTMSGSYSSASGSLSTRVTTIESKYATTGSNIFTGAQTVCANITSTGTIIAQTLNVQQVTSSIVYSSGSNIFGCSLSNTQQFTGSVTMTGSLSVFTAGTSPEFQVAVGGTTKGNALTDTHNVTGSLRITGSFNTIGNACITSICSPAIDVMPSGIGVSTLGGIMRVVTTGTSTGIAVGQSNANRYTHFAANDIQVFNDDYFISTRCAFPLSIGTCYTARLTFAATGVACFNCQICTSGTMIRSGADLRLYRGLNDYYWRIYSDSSNFLQLGPYFSNDTPYSSCNTLTFRDDGKVGIGTCSPVNLLHLYGTDGNSYIRWTSDVATTGTRIGYNGTEFRIDQQQSADITLRTNGCERMRITSDGCVGIGTPSPNGLLHIQQCRGGEVGFRITNSQGAAGNTSATVAINMTLQNGAGGSSGVIQLIAGKESDHQTAANVDDYFAITTTSNDTTTERMRITSGGSVVFQCSLNMCNGGAINMTIPSGTNGGSIRMACCTGPNEGDMFLTGGSGNIGILIAGSGRVGIGTTTPSYALQVNGPSNSNAAYFRAGGTSGFASVAFSGESGTALGVLATTTGCIFLGRANGTIGNQFGAEGDIMINCANGNVRMNNSLTIVGSLSKGSGSFRIKHPLLSKKCTHELVHSFIEGPNADLIYSGRTTLTNGVSCINIDCTARMTQGTFEALNRCVRVFTTNESSWDQVRGKVVGNILVIESQNSESTDNISWMVIGERQDEHMFETEWTDHEGRVITEPEVKE